MKKSKIKKIFSWILQVLLGLEFLIAGQSKFTSMSSWESRFDDWGYPDNFFMIIGIVEVVCAVLLFFPKLAGYAALVLSIVMISASATHIIHNESPIVDMVILLLLLTLFYLRIPEKFKVHISKQRVSD